MLNSSVLVLNRGTTRSTSRTPDGPSACCTRGLPGRSTAVRDVRLPLVERPRGGRRGPRHRRRGEAVRIPRVVVLVAYDRVPRRNVRFSRRNIFVRDRNTASIAGSRSPAANSTLTTWSPLQGGKTNWENIVCSCIPCNKRKAGIARGDRDAAGLRPPDAPLVAGVRLFPPDPHPQGMGSVPQRGRLHVLEPRTPGLNPQTPSGRGATSSSLLFVVGTDLAFAEPRDAQRRHRPAGPSSPLRPGRPPPGHLRGFLRIVRAGNFLGGNVTIPYKEEAATLADTRSEAVEVCGAANTLVVRGGRLHAEKHRRGGVPRRPRIGGWDVDSPGRPPRRRRGGPRIAFALGRAGAGRSSC